MAKRERVLLIAFLAVGGCALAYWGFKTQIAGRLEEAEASISRARKSTLQAQKQLVESRAAKLELARWEKLSLTPDPNTAVPQYQAFLLDLLQQCGFAEPTITPRSPSMQNDTYWRLPFDIQARGSLESLVTFVDAFHRIELLHKLGRLSLTPLGQQGTGELDLRFGVEVLALVTDAGSDVADQAAGSEESSVSAQSENATRFSQLLADNLLMRHGPGPSARPGYVAAQVYLTGTIITGETREALFYNRATGESLALRLGDRLAIGDVRGELMDLGFRDVVLEIEGDWYALTAGENLGQRRALTDSEALSRALDASHPEVTLRSP